ncbi:MAG: hypothetical protein V4628_12170 [Pseudomonadota bacterium]
MEWVSLKREYVTQWVQEKQVFLFSKNIRQSDPALARIVRQIVPGHKPLPPTFIDLALNDD